LLCFLGLCLRDGTSGACCETDFERLGGACLEGHCAGLPDVFPDVLDQIAASEKNAAPDDAAERGIRNHFRMLFYSEKNRDAYLAGAKDLGAPKVGTAVREERASAFV
jgi:hypothetical protein